MDRMTNDFAVSAPRASAYREGNITFEVGPVLRRVVTGFACQEVSSTRGSGHQSKYLFFKRPVGVGGAIWVNSPLSLRNVASHPPKCVFAEGEVMESSWNGDWSQVVDN